MLVGILLWMVIDSTANDETMKTLSDEQIQKIFDRLEEIDISLDPNPIERGPKYLNNMVAEVRNKANEVRRFQRLVLQEKRQLEQILNRKETEYNLKFDDLMATNDQVQKRSSKSDREAMANSMLKDLREEIMDLESELEDAKLVEETIDSKLSELRDLNRDIRLQKKLIQEEIEIGSAWGDNTSKGDNQIEVEDSEIGDLLGDSLDDDTSSSLDKDFPVEEDSGPSNSDRNDDSESSPEDTETEKDLLDQL